MEYAESGTEFDAEIPKKDYGRLEQFNCQIMLRGILLVKYKTVMKAAETEQTIERSRFIGHVKPVESREEAEEFIAEIRSKHKAATHNVPAFVIGDRFQLQWAKATTANRRARRVRPSFRCW